MDKKYFYKINAKHFSKAEGRKVEMFCVEMNERDDIAAKLKAARIARAFWKLPENRVISCEILEIAEI